MMRKEAGPGPGGQQPERGAATSMQQVVDAAIHCR